tara:strand:+ start:5671 stop:7299 length:1629 start_codon:yes stop_codon:yes gene_type:complete
MASLADINQTLQEQNVSLREIAASSDVTQSLILKQINQDTGFKAIEEERERRFSLTGAAEGASRGIRDTGQRLGDFGGKLGNFLSGAGIAGLAGSLAGILIKRGIPALLITAFSNNIADYIVGEGDEETKEVIERAINTGALGFLAFGVKGAIFGAILGAILDDNAKAELKKLGKNIKEAGTELGIILPSFKGTVEAISNTFTGAIKGINNIMTGDILKGLNENLDDMIKIVGGLFVLFNPFGTIGAGIKLIKTIFKTGIGGLTAATALSGTAASTATGVGATAATGVGAAKQLDLFDGDKNVSDKERNNLEKNVKRYPKLGKFLSLAKGLGPLAAILGVADVVRILASSGDVSGKLDQIAGAIGGSAGGLVLGSAAGTVLGGFGGPAAIAGTIIGGIGGAFLGNSVAKGLAQFLLDRPVDAFPNFLGLNQLLNSIGGGGGTNASVPDGSPPGAFGFKFDKPFLSMGSPTPVGESINNTNLSDNTMGRGFPSPAVTMQDASTKQVNNISNTSQPVVAPIVNNMDVNDALMNYYQTGPFPGGI